MVSTTTAVSGDPSRIAGIVARLGLAGHVQVEHQHARLQARGAATGGVGVARLGDDLHVALGLDDAPESIADDLVIVREDDRDRAGFVGALRVSGHQARLGHGIRL